MSTDATALRSGVLCMIEPIKPTRAVRRRADPDDPDGYWKRANQTGGTGWAYLYRRINRIRPDLVEQWAAAGYDCSMRQLAIRAGILPDIAPEDRALENLLIAWKRADIETREVFLSLIEDWEELPQRRRGPRALISKGAPEVLVRLRDKMPMSDLAKALGVSRETVRRWCAAESKPRAKHITAMQAIVDGGE